MRMLKSGLLYFTLVFAAGFMLGTIRIFWVAPRIGERTAELLEAPVMLLISVLVARWLVRTLGVPSMFLPRLGMGCIALVFMLVAEFTLAPWLRGISIRQYFAERDPVAATVYYVTLGVFALIPLLVERKAN